MHIVRVFGIRENRMGEGLMNKKNDILESWIMVEHLSEGDINLKDKAILNFNDLQRQDYYSLLADEIQKKGLKKISIAELLFILIFSHFRK